ncbi:MAG: hypothetical protein Q7K26_06320 [bacterium]|nr:hypothetical protein [bacterium]
MASNLTSEKKVNIDESTKVPQSGLKEYIVSLALRRDVAYVKTYSDEWAATVTRLVGDDVEMDDIECTLIALRRAGVINTKQMGILLVAYLRENFNV